MSASPNIPTQHHAIVGASGGIGEALALELAGPSTHLHLLGRSRERLQPVANLVLAKGGDASIVQVDLTDPQQVVRAGRSLTKGCKRLASLLHCAGAFQSSPLEELPAEELARLLAVNLQAPVLLSRELLPSLRQHGESWIVFLNSSVVGQKRERVTAYAASKSGLQAAADSLRQEVNPDGIRICSLFLGATATAMQQRIHEQAGRSYLPERLLQPDQVAGLIVTLLRQAPELEVTDLHIRPARPHR